MHIRSEKSFPGCGGRRRRLARRPAAAAPRGLARDLPLEAALQPDGPVLL